MAKEKADEAIVAETVDQNAYLHELVPFYAFRDNGRYKDDITVGLNGKIYRIRRGEQVMIPRAVALIIQNSMDQDAKTANLIDGMSRQYDAESRRWN